MVGKSNKIGFMEFLSIDERNVYVSFHNLHGCFELFRKLEGLIAALIPEDKTHQQHEIKLKLYFLFMGYVYSSFASFIRGHYDQSLSAIRIAIEAALNAYVLQRAPELESEFSLPYSRRKNLKRIKDYIKAENRKFPAKFVIDTDVLEFHNYCSNRGSHASHDLFEKRINKINLNSFDYLTQIAFHDIEINSQKDIEGKFIKNVLHIAKTLLLFKEVFPFSKHFPLTKECSISSKGLLIPKDIWKNELDNLIIDCNKALQAGCSLS